VTGFRALKPKRKVHSDNTNSLGVSTGVAPWWQILAFGYPAILLMTSGYQGLYEDAISNATARCRRTPRADTADDLIQAR
jgi:hypothetical protein